MFKEQMLQTQCNDEGMSIKIETRSCAAAPMLQAGQDVYQIPRKHSVSEMLLRDFLGISLNLVPTRYSQVCQ